ncbi:MAG: hypothetical protein QHC90_08010 [Shinella sp.]|nr:hypothetical protein [Shinella sp.]
MFAALKTFIDDIRISRPAGESRHVDPPHDDERERPEPEAADRLYSVRESEAYYWRAHPFCWY